MSLLKVKSLSIKNGSREICNNLDLEIEKDQSWGILGCNGIGKTSLLQSFAGIKRADSGEIWIDERKISQWTRKELARKVGVLFQDSNDSFPVSVIETAMCGRHPYLPFWAAEAAEDFEPGLSLRWLSYYLEQLRRWGRPRGSHPFRYHL